MLVRFQAQRRRTFDIRPYGMPALENAGKAIEQGMLKRLASKEFVSQGPRCRAIEAEDNGSLWAGCKNHRNCVINTQDVWRWSRPWHTLQRQDTWERLVLWYSQEAKGIEHKVAWAYTKNSRLRLLVTEFWTRDCFATVRRNIVNLIAWNVMGTRLASSTLTRPGYNSVLVLGEWLVSETIKTSMNLL